MRNLEVLGSQGGMYANFVCSFGIALGVFCKLREFELWWGFCEQIVWGETANLRSFHKPAGIELEQFFW